MGSRDEALKRLGRRLDEEQRALLQGRARDPRERERFITAALARRSAARRRLVTQTRAAVAFAAIAAALLVVLWLGRRPSRQEGQFELRRENDSPTRSLPPPAGPIDDPALSSGDAPPALSAIPAPSLPPASPSARPRAPRQSWRELSAAGKFKEAIEAADREGFLRICAEGSSADLRDLADSARLSGDSARSIVALTTLRRRFPGDDQAAESAFLLGVIAAGAGGGHGEALQWFTTYLSERPRGRLAREAAGRLIEAHEKSGNRAAAQESARRYLRDYPGGPHAEMAKAILSE